MGASNHTIRAEDYITIHLYLISQGTYMVGGTIWIVGGFQPQFWYPSLLSHFLNRNYVLDDWGNIVIMCLL